MLTDQDTEIAEGALREGDDPLVVDPREGHQLEWIHDQLEEVGEDDANVEDENEGYGVTEVAVFGALGLGYRSERFRL